MKEGEQFVADAVVLAHQPPYAVPRYDSSAISAGSDPHGIPVGRWRDGICDFAKNGCCHPMCCLACWCEPLALGQVMTRLNLSPCCARTPGGKLGRFLHESDEGGSSDSKLQPQNVRRPFWTAFKVLAVLLFVEIAVDQAFDYWIDPYFAYDVDGDGNVVMEYAVVPTWVLAMIGARALMRFAFFLYTLVLTMKTRAFVRNRYQIPETTCRGCEDCCCAFWLPCCTITQMARHTADYDHYPAACCTETGLSSHVPEVIV